MTRDEFVKGYAERSDVSVNYLQMMGFAAIPCDCGEEECLGWQMTRDAAKVEEALRRAERRIAETEVRILELERELARREDGNA